MSKSLVLKANLLEQGINVLKEAKKELDKIGRASCRERV